MCKVLASIHTVFDMNAKMLITLLSMHHCNLITTDELPVIDLIEGFLKVNKAHEITNT